MSEDEAYELAPKEDGGVCKWRKDEALAAGLSIVEAKIFSESPDLELRELRHLVKRGATPAQIRAVLFGPVSSDELRQSPHDRAPAAG